MLLRKCATIFRTCDDIAKRLGYDWLLLFMQSHIHSSSVVLALRILLVMFRNNDNVKRFREGSYGGGWMGGTELVLKNQMSVMLGKNNKKLGYMLVFTSITCNAIVFLVFTNIKIF